jgi:hypothetical protein
MYMSKTIPPLLSKDTLKTIYYGALGTITFGSYNLWIINKNQELNNRVQNMKHMKHTTETKKLLNAQKLLHDAQIHNLELQLHNMTLWWWQKV